MVQSEGVMKQPVWFGRKVRCTTRAGAGAIAPVIEGLESRCLLSGADPVITEFMADNKNGRVDYQGTRQDWIEIYNPGPDIDLSGWRLTDNANEPGKWVFPSTVLGSGQYLVVFASEKNRTTPEFHTNFKLGAGGEYLGLIKPDGTVASAYAPEYPDQVTDISYGLGAPTTTSVTPITPGHQGRVWVPLDGGVDGTWMQAGFNDLGWYNASTGIGYAVQHSPLPAEIEPNDQTSTASDATYNFSSYTGNLYHLGFSGAIAAAGDEDWINIGAMQVGDVINLTLGGLDSAMGTLANPRLELYRAGTSGAVTTSSDGGPGLDSLIRQFSIATADTYYLRVLGTNSTYGTYRVGAWLANTGTPPVTGGAWLTETESNNTKATANNASSSWRAAGYLSRTSGNIASSADVDMIRYQFTAGDLVTVNIDSTAGVDARVWLLDAAGNTLGLEDGTSSFLAPYDKDSPVFGFIIPSTGTYYVKVGSTTAGATGSYNADVYLSTATPPPAPASADAYAGVIATNLAGLMFGKSASAYLRLPFTLNDPAEFNSLTLRMKYDDGFAVYLNGTPVASRNAPASLAFSSMATAEHSGAGALAYETIDLSAYVGLLQAENVLAIHALNVSQDDGDLLLIPELTASSIQFGPPQYFTTPTPGSQNVPGALGRVADTKFSHDRGFFEEAFDLALSTATAGATIRYTTDGSVPTATTGMVYTGPVRISTTTAVRAAAYKSGWISTDVDTHTYLFLNDVLHQPVSPAGFPTYWNGAPAADYEMDPEVVFNAAAPTGVIMGGIYYFSGHDAAGGYELWRSDGTDAGTWRVKDVYPGMASSSPRNLYAAGNTLYFVAGTQAAGRELWRSDGTETGTQLVKDIYAGQNTSAPDNFAAMDGVLYFAAADGSGRELWRSNGTSAGTFRVSDINAGSVSSNPTELTVLGSTLFFAATTATNGTELWKSDGTSATTTLVRDIHATGSSSPAMLRILDGQLYFVADDGLTGRELWKSDGSLAATGRVVDLAGGSASSNITGMADLDGALYIIAGNGQLWKTTGSSASYVTTISPSSPAPTGLLSHNGTLWFIAGGDQLWTSNGTSAGTSRVLDINAASYAGANPAWLMPAGGLVYFAAATAGSGQELWRSDGTAAGTFIVKDIYAGPEGSTPASIAADGAKLLFLATDQTAGYQVWKTDGTSAGTAMVKDIQPGSPPSITSNDLRSIPTLSIVMKVDDWFKNTNSPAGTGGIYSFPTSQDADNAVNPVWERGASIELIDGDGSTGFQIDGGVQIQGGASRTPSNSPKHSLRLLFKERYGAGKLDYDWFGGDATDEFDAIVLKANYNNGWVHHNEADTYSIIGGQRERTQYVHDQWASETQLAMGQASKHSAYVHLYINGLYWGLYSPMERPEADWAASYFGGSSEDYDVMNNEDALIDGSRTAWDEMFNIANRATTDPRWIGTAEGYADIQQYLDIPAFIDYMLMNFYGDNRDWADHNWYAVRRSRVDGLAVNADGFRFISFDAERILELPTGNSVINLNQAKRPTGLFQQLRKNAEFVMAFADRVRKHLFNGGALTPEQASQRYLGLVAQIDRAVLGESARWGDYRRDVHPRGTPTPIPLYTRENQWLTEQARLLNEYFPVRTSNLLGYLRSASLYPSLAAPDFSQFGATSNDPLSITITRPGGVGVIWYTLDGSDPRLAGGAVSPSAIAYTGPSLLLQSSILLKARILNGTTWSALTEAPFVIGPPPDLRVTEVMYHPADPPANTPYLADAFEYIELQNLGGTELDLGGMTFTRGIKFTFPLGTSLEAGGRLVLVKNIDAFQLRYGTGIAIGGQFAGDIGNGGERITLTTHLGQVVDDFEYKDSWYPHTDGEGFSLVAIDPMALKPEKSSKSAWRASEANGGNPMAGDNGENPGAIVINEILTHSDDPLGDWIELHNTTGHAISIGGWAIGDSNSNLVRFIIPAGTVLQAGQFIVYHQATDFPAWGFSENGEEAHLSSMVNGALGGYRESVDFAAADNGVTFGRHLKSDGSADFVAMSMPTMGQANAYPAVGPVVISEIMYNPAGAGGTFVELHNLTDSDVSLANWRFTDGIDCTFATGAKIPAGGYALVVKMDPAAFAALYGIPAGVPIFGPFTGDLDNAGEKLELSKPNLPDPGEDAAYIIVDRVHYDDDLPWPTTPDGDGPSLVREPLGGYGNDVINWTAGRAGGSPGGAEAVVLSDTAPGTHWRLALDDTQTLIYVYRSAGESSGTPHLVLPRSTPVILVDSPQAVVTIDLTNGNPLPSSGVYLNAGSGQKIEVVGSAGDDTIAITQTQLLIGGLSVTHDGSAQLAIDGGLGEDTLQILGGTHAIGAPAGVEKLTVRNAGTLAQLTESLSLSAVSVEDGAAMDIGAHQLTIDPAGTSMQSIRAMLFAGRDGGSWAGDGIRSSAAAADPRTGVAAVLDGSGQILIKHAYHGDANADGRVDGADYHLADLGFLASGLGWAAGDFDYDDDTDGDDYFRMDSAFLQQTAILAPAAAATSGEGRGGFSRRNEAPGSEPSPRPESRRQKPPLRAASQPEDAARSFAAFSLVRIRPEAQAAGSREDVPEENDEPDIFALA